MPKGAIIIIIIIIIIIKFALLSFISQDNPPGDNSFHAAKSLGS